MTTLREAAQAALEALETRGEHHPRVYRAIEVLRAALAELPKLAFLKRGTTGRCTRKVCECEKEGLGLECIHLEPVVDGYPLWSGIPKAEPALNPAPGYCKHCRQYTIEEPLPAEPVEPVAWIQPDHLQKARRAPFLCRVEPTKRMVDFVPLYTSPPQRKPLTKEEIHTLRLSIPATTPFLDAVVLYTRAVEAAHGIK